MLNTSICLKFCRFLEVVLCKLQFLPDEISPDNLLRNRTGNSRVLSRLNALQQPRHILRKRGKRLETLRVLEHLLWQVSVNLVPVLRTYHRHVIDGEVLVELVERCGGSAPAALTTPAAGLNAMLFPPE